MNVLLVDNLDSFTWNLAHQLGRLGAEVQVVRADELDVDRVRTHRPDAVVLSPGPDAPTEEHVGVAVARECLDASVPFLGVCLGMQCLAFALGARIVRLPRVVHGAATPLRHDGSLLFAGLEQGTPVGRYHSLVVDSTTLPAELRLTATTDGDVAMAVAHARLPALGVQFHPESILTPAGAHVVAAVLTDARRRASARPEAA